MRTRPAEIAASSRRILTAADEERGRLEGRLRDGAQWRLGELAHALRQASQSATGPGTAERIARAKLQLARTQEDLGRLGKLGSGPGEFTLIAFDPTTPDDIHGKIAVGPRGMVYVSDSGNSRVQVFTLQGRFVRQFGSYGSGKGQFLHASDLVVD